MKSADDYSLLAKGLVERIGGESANISHKKTGCDRFIVEKPIPDHTEGIKSVLALLTDKEQGVLSSLKDIDAVGHRVAHGGEFFFESCAVNDDVIEKIEKCC